MGNYMIEEYITKMIGLTFMRKGSAQALTKSLPQYLKGSFRFSLIEIEKQEFLLIEPLAEIGSTSQVIKFAEKIRQQTGVPTLIQFDSMDSVRRRTLISHRENFVVPDKQIYIPSLRMYLNEAGNILQLTGKEKLSPSSRLLLLYHLQKVSLEGIPFMDIAEMLDYSKKTISVVAAELQKFSICEVEPMDTRTKTLRFKEKGRDLWNKASSLMDSPVQQTWFINKEHLQADLPLYASYDKALAHYTFMADATQAAFAVSKKVFSVYHEQLQTFLHPNEGDVRLEIWKYNPAIVADGQFIDRLSMALCYRETDDERVNKEITTMIDKFVW
jgi:DNA-binding MarR family transcriptional regulator